MRDGNMSLVKKSYDQELREYAEDPCKCTQEEECDESCINRESSRECGLKCPTGDKCTNRELQKQAFVDHDKYFWLKEFEKKGKGLMARIDLPAVSYYITLIHVFVATGYKISGFTHF